MCVCMYVCMYTFLFIIAEQILYEQIPRCLTF